MVGSGANQQFIVQWNNIRQLGGTAYFTLQAVLTSDGTIQLNYGAGVSPVVGTATVGVKAAGTSNPQRLLVSFGQPAGPLVGSNLSTRIAVSQATPDYYAFALAAGQTAALAVTGQAAGSLNLELRSAADALLATGSAGATNVTTAINAFTAPAAGTYYARIAGGSNVPYSLVVTKNATFDLEANDTAATAQSLTGSGAALGAITAANVDWYWINVTAGARLRIESSTPATGNGQFANALNPRLELHDPANNLTGSGVVLADGLNESLVASCLTAGIYKVRVSGEGATTGEYLLTSELSAAPVISVLTATTPLVEGGSTTVNGAFTSPNCGPHTVVIQWGLGQGSTTLNLAAGVLTFSNTHPYLNNSPAGGYTISVTVASAGGTSAAASDIAVVINAAPTIASIAAPSAIFENDTHTITGVYRDLGTLDTHAVVITWGPGEGTTTLTTAGPNPAGSTLVALGSGEWQFTASHQYRDDNPSATPIDVYPISISITDDDGGTIGGSTAVTVRNIAPSVSGLAATSIAENETSTLSGTISDVGTLDTFSVLIDWGNGSETITGVSAGTFSYTRRYLNDSPTGGYSIAVTVTDDDGATAAANTSVAVANVVPAITTLTAPGTIDENGTFAIAGEFNDPGTLDAHTIIITWGAGEATTAISTALPPPSGATLVSLGNGNWRFTASHQYLDDSPTGTPSDLFTIGVSVADEVGGIIRSTGVTVNNVPPTPSIVGASDPKLEGNAISVTGSATDVSSLDLLAYAWQVFKVGSLTPFAAGGNFTTFSFTPDNDGDYRIELTATDDDGGATTVSQTIAVANVAPTASNLAVVTDEDQGTGVALVATDVPADTISFLIASGPQHGALTGTAPNLIYTPTADYHGPDSFTYRASDGALAGNLATVVLTVTPVNDAPVAASDTYSTAEDAPLVVAAPGVLSGDADIDNNPLTAAIVAGPAHGTLTLSLDGSFRYAPALNYHGADSFTYQASDALTVSGAATVSLTVTPVNDPPAATGASYMTAEDVPLSAAAPGVLTSAADVDGDALTASVVDGPAHGTLVLDPAGGFIYAPSANYHGPDSFTYRANDGSLNSNVATVSLTITPVNDAPLAAGDFFTATEDAALSAAAPGVLGGDADIDGDSLAAAVASGPAHGTLILQPDGSFTYTPDANFSGSDSFTYLASDAAAAINIATVTLSVTPVNDAPTAAADQTSGPENAPLVVGSPGLLANDTDVDVGDTRTVVAVNGQIAAVGTPITLASGALLTVQSDGSYAYDPNGRFALLVVGQSASDGFTYAFVDSAGAAATATVTIDVLGVTIPNSIAGSVYADVNNSGQRDAPELGLPTVLVVLEGPIVRLTRTDSAGNYRFDGLPRGDYTVWEYHPQSFLDGIDTRGEPSLGTVANDRFEAVSLTSGVVAGGYNFGERGLLNPSKALSLASTATTLEIMMAVLAEDEPAGLEAQIAPTLRATAPPIPVLPGRLDVSQDGFVSAIDAILIINELNAPRAAGAEGESASLLAAAASDSRLDTNADGSVSPIDAVLVINYLNSHRSASATLAEGESDGQLAAAAVDSQADGSLECDPEAALLDSLLTLLADDLCQSTARPRKTVAL